MALFMRAREVHVGVGRTDAYAINLSPVPASALAARVAVERFLGRAGGRGTVVALVASELVTNAVVHAGTTVGLRIGRPRGRGTALIEVRDGAPLVGHRLRPRRQARPGHHTTGRGLAMVSQLSISWGVRPETEGKTVWALVRAEDPTADQLS